MSSWLLFLKARSARTASLVLVCVTIAVVIAGPAVYELQVVASQPPRYLPIWEVAPVIGASVIPALLVPRMWSWERTGDVQMLRVYAGVSAVLAIAAPSLVPAVCALTVLPDEARWVDVSFNVAAISAVAMLAATALGRVLGPLVGLGAYVALVAVQQAAPGLASWVPLSVGDRSLTVHALVSLAASAIAITAWTSSLGRSRAADRFSVE